MARNPPPFETELIDNGAGCLLFTILLCNIFGAVLRLAAHRFAP